MNTVYAQYPSDNGQFEVNVLQGCAPLTVEITNPCANCADYDFNNDGNGDGTSFTYTNAGNFTIEAFAAGGTITDQVTISVHNDTIPQFNVYRCGNRSVEVNINDDNYDSYLINWGDGNSTTISGTDDQELYTYASGGNKNISVTGLYTNGAGNCSSNTKAVNDIANLPVAVINEIGPVGDDTDKVYIKFTADPNALYKLQLAVNNATNWIPAQDVSPEKDSIVISSLLLEDNFYCFRIATLNACLGGNPPEAFSSPVCTQTIDVDFTNNEQSIVNWSTASDNVARFEIFREEVASSSLASFTAQSSERSFTDNSVTCNTDYCYTIIAHYNTGATSTSLEMCGTALLKTTPPAVDNIVTQVNGDDIDVTWTPPANTDAESYHLFRSVNDAPFDVAANDLTDPQFNDTGLSPGTRSYCYELNYEDRCGNFSAMTREVCALRLSGGAVNLQLVELNWNSFNGFSSGVSEYLLEIFDANGSLMEAITLNRTSYSDTLTLDDPQEIHYRITAIPNDNTLPNAISNVLVVTRESIVRAPNAFIPGSGGENSVFKIFSPFIAEIDLRIYNRWGELIYQTNNPEIGWPGTDQEGNPVPQGTYVYQAFLVSEAGEESEAYGNVLLLRR